MALRLVFIYINFRITILALKMSFPKIYIFLDPIESSGPVLFWYLLNLSKADALRENEKHNKIFLKCWPCIDHNQTCTAHLPLLYLVLSAYRTKRRQSVCTHQTCIHPIAQQIQTVKIDRQVVYSVECYINCVYCGKLPCVKS